jgi:hypothetical protein
MNQPFVPRTLEEEERIAYEEGKNFRRSLSAEGRAMMEEGLVAEPKGIDVNAARVRGLLRGLRETV